MNEIKDKTFWFPGRWVGGIALIIAPILLFMSTMLRGKFHYFFDSQLAAYSEHPILITAAYSCFVMGNVFMWPAIITLARSIGMKNPAWAVWGGVLVIFGLFTRTFHGGIDHLAFQLVDVQNLETATETVDKSYSAFHIMRHFNGAIVVGWIVLAIGAYRSGVLGLFRSIAMGSMAFLPLGTLKGTRVESIFVTAALCIALIPLGIKVLRDGPRPSRRAIIWTVVLAALQIILICLWILFPEQMMR